MSELESPYHDIDEYLARKLERISIVSPPLYSPWEELHFPSVLKGILRSEWESAFLERACQTPLPDTDIATNQSDKFHRFPLLPLELRLKIWHVLISHPRLLPLKEYEHEEHAGSEEPRRTRVAEIRATTYEPPIVLHINRESRAEGLRHYMRMESPYPIQFDNWCNYFMFRDTDRGIERRHIYFNPEVDILYIGSSECACHLSNAIGCGFFPRVALKLKSGNGGFNERYRRCCERLYFTHFVDEEPKTKVRPREYINLLQALHGLQGYKNPYRGAKGIKEIIWLAAVSSIGEDPDDDDDCFLDASVEVAEVEDSEICAWTKRQKVHLDLQIERVHDGKGVSFTGVNRWVGKEKGFVRGKVLRKDKKPSILKYEGLGAKDIYYDSSDDEESVARREFDSKDPLDLFYEAQDKPAIHFAKLRKPERTWHNPISPDIRIPGPNWDPSSVRQPMPPYPVSSKLLDLQGRLKLESTLPSSRRDCNIELVLNVEGEELGLGQLMDDEGLDCWDDDGASLSSWESVPVGN